VTEYGSATEGLCCMGRRIDYRTERRRVLRRLSALAKLGISLFLRLIVTCVGVALEKPAQATNIRVACAPNGVYHEDPIRPDSGHAHVFYGNTLVPFATEGFSDLYNHKETSCNASWWTSHIWNPTDGDQVSMADVYYNKFGATNIRPIPNGLKLLSTRVTYGCGGGPGNPPQQQSTPPYGCTTRWSTFYHFPRCYDGSGALTPGHTVYGPTKSSCPTDHPYVLPSIYYIAIHPNGDGKVPNPLRISCGVDQTCSYTSNHADYLFAAQRQFNHAVDLNHNGVLERNFKTVDQGLYSEASLVNLCHNWSPDELEYNNERCRAGGLLPAQKDAIARYNATH
jgi:hypothetical protein